MKKLGVLFVTLLTAIIAFSFSAFASESPVNVDTTLTLNSSGKGFVSTYYSFSKEHYDFDCGLDITLRELIPLNFKASGLARYCDLTIIDSEGQDHVGLEFLFYFNSMQELNDTISNIDQCIYGSDVENNSSIKTQNNKAELTLSGYTISMLQVATDTLLFLDTAISDNGTKYNYFVDFDNGEKNTLTELDASSLSLDNVYTLSYNIKNDAKSTVAPSAKPVHNTVATVAPTSTSKSNANKVSVKANTNQKDKTPKTGDSSKILLLVILMIASLSSMIFVVAKKVRKTN